MVYEISFPAVTVELLFGWLLNHLQDLKLIESWVSLLFSNYTCYLAWSGRIIVNHDFQNDVKEPIHDIIPPCTW